MEFLNDDAKSEDALTHGVTVMECEEKYQDIYFDYLLKQWKAGRISLAYFDGLIEGYYK
jgi:activator of HSP90 ATPase